MLVLIYSILRNTILNGDSLKSILAFGIILLIVGYAFSLWGNSLTGSKKTTTAYSKGVKSLLGRAVTGLFTGAAYLLRFICWITPRWVYNKMMTLLNGKVRREWIRVMISVGTAILVVDILI